MRMCDHGPARGEMRQLAINRDTHGGYLMRTMAYLLFLLGIAASEPAQLLVWAGIEIGPIIPFHPLIPAVQMFGEAVQAVRQIVQ